MKRWATSLLVLMMTMGSASAQRMDGVGVGVIIGKPTGISLKKWIDNEHAIDAAAAWSFSGHNELWIHADYLLHNFALLRATDARGRLPLYYGIGGQLKVREKNGHQHDHDDDVSLGIRAPLGMSYLLSRSPVDFFIEVVPILYVAPDTDFILTAAIGARYYF